MRSLLLILLLPLSAHATTWYVRNAAGNVGGTTTQCSGTSDSNYPGAGSGLSCAYRLLQDAMNAASYGDTIIMLKTSTSDQVTIPAKVGTPSMITVQSSGLASIASGQLHGVTNADAVNMAKIATTHDNFAVSIPSGQTFWTFKGFEITTANRSQYYTILIDHAGTNVNFERSWIHSQEDYTDNPEASCRIGINYSGSSSSFTDCRIAYFSAYVLGTTIVDNNFALIYEGSTLTITNSYMGAWFDTIISGGTSFAPAVSNVTISGAPTLSAATVSTTSQLNVGDLIALRNYPQRTLTNACSFTASTKTLVCTGGNFNAAYKDLSGAGTPRFSFPSLGVGAGVTTVVNSTTLVMENDLGGSNFSAQTVNIDGVYGSARVTGISGNDLTYSPYGITALQAAPEVPGNVQWNGFVPNNLTITRTMLYNNPVIAASVFATTGNNPKAFWEVKAVDGLTVDGCEFTGFGTNLGFLVANQGTPDGCPSVWTRIKNVTFSNNWYHTDLNQFQIMGLTLFDHYFCTSSGGSNINVFNNLFTSGAVLSRLSGGTNVQFRHNTAINDDQPSGAQLIQQEASGVADNTLQFNYSDNIAYQNTYGLNCSYGPTALICYTSPTLATNIFIGPLQNGPYCGSGYPVGNLCLLTQSAVKFVNAAGNNYQLAADSPGKGTGTGGTDRGVIWSTLVAGLGFDPSGATVGAAQVSGKTIVSGKFKVGP